MKTKRSPILSAAFTCSPKRGSAWAEISETPSRPFLRVTRGVGIATNTDSEAFVNQNMHYTGTPTEGWVSIEKNDTNTENYSSIGTDGWTWSKPLNYRAVYRADGSAIHFVKYEDDTAWATLYYVQAGIGVTNGNPEAGTPWEQCDQPTKAGNEPDYTSTALPDLTGKAAYPALAFVNAADNHDYVLRNISVKKLGVADAVTETVSDTHNDWCAFRQENNISFEVAQPALVVDNAADDDFLVKKTAFSAPASLLNPYLYDVSFDVYADELTANGESVIYIGARDKTTLEGAAEIYFRKDATKGTVIGVRNQTAEGPEQIEETETEFDVANTKFKSVTIRNLNTGENVLSLDGTEVARFRKELAGTYLAFGTKTGDGTARLAVRNAVVRKYSYVQGTGDSFTEDFDDNMYNFDNLLIQVHPDYALPGSVEIKDGALVLDDAYGVTIGTMESYSDFEFKFTIKDYQLSGDPSSWDSMSISIFGFGFGKPIAESGECNSWLQWQGNCTLDVVEGLTFMEYGRPEGKWLTPLEDPTYDEQDQLDPENGFNIYTHDYSKSGIVVKFRKVDEKMDVFVYCENEEEDSLRRTTPFQSYNVYGSGAFDIRTLATGVHVSMTLDDISVTNLDATKGALNPANPDNRAEFVIVEEPDPGPGPGPGPGPNQPEPEKPNGGCGKSQASAAAMTVIGLLGTAFFLKRR